MEQPKKKERKRSATKIIPPKKTENLSRDEVRSINKKKVKRKRKIKKAVALGLLTCLIVCVSVLLVMTVFFKINTVKISGSRVYPDGFIMEESGIEIGSGLFTVNEKKLNEILPKELPYIKSVKVTRKLPDTLNIEVFSTREVAAFTYGSGYVLVDENGKILAKDATMLKDNVALVSGVKLNNPTPGTTVSLNDEKTKEDFIGLLKSIKENEFDLVTEIILTEQKTFKLVYEDRITIKLGVTDDFDKKILLAKASIEKENQINPYSEGVLDLEIEPYAYFKSGEEEELTIAPEYVTDGEGNVVTDSEGHYVTHPSSTASEDDGQQEDE